MHHKTADAPKTAGRVLRWARWYDLFGRVMSFGQDKAIRQKLVLMRTTIGWIIRGLAIVAALLATVQPALGSFAFFRRGDPVDYETIHLALGGIIYNLALLLVVLVLFTRFRRRWILFSVCLVQYGLTHIQLRLGLGSNDDAALLAYHIPVGVLIFFLSYLTVALSFGLHFESSRA